MDTYMAIAFELAKDAVVYIAGGCLFILGMWLALGGFRK